MTTDYNENGSRPRAVEPAAGGGYFAPGSGLTIDTGAELHEAKG